MLNFDSLKSKQTSFFSRYRHDIKSKPTSHLVASEPQINRQRHIFSSTPTVMISFNMPKTVEVCVAGTHRWHEAIIVDISSSDGTLTVEYPREYVPAETSHVLPTFTTLCAARIVHRFHWGISLGVLHVFCLFCGDCGVAAVGSRGRWLSLHKCVWPCPIGIAIRSVPPWGSKWR